MKRTISEDQAVPADAADAAAGVAVEAQRHPAARRSGRHGRTRHRPAAARILARRWQPTVTLRDPTRYCIFPFLQTFPITPRRRCRRPSRDYPL
jgi:hypothetical protein